MQIIELANDRQSLKIAPDIGAALLGWEHAGLPVLRGVRNPALVAQKNTPVGAYPLIPYSNRIADGRFSFEGHEYRLKPNMEGCPHSIHGNAWEGAWTLAHQTSDTAVLTFDSDLERDAAGWPFNYRAALSYRLHGDGIGVRIVVENRDMRLQPVGFGYHPFFAVGKRALVSLRGDYAWSNDARGLPKDKMPLRGEWDFAQGRPIEDLDIDHCLAGVRKALIQDPDYGRDIEITADPVFRHMLVFHPKDADFLAVEPVSNVTDAIHFPPSADTGLRLLKPGARIGGEMRFRIGPCSQ